MCKKTVYRHKVVEMKYQGTTFAACCKLLFMFHQPPFPNSPPSPTHTLIIICLLSASCHNLLHTHTT